MELDFVLEEILGKIDEINDYMNFVGNYLVKDFKKVFRKNKNSYHVAKYLDCLLGDVLENDTEEELKKAERISKKFIEIKEIDTEKNVVKYRYKNNSTKMNIVDDRKEILNSALRLMRLNNSILVNLIIEFESFMNNIFKYIIHNYPKVYLDKENIKYSTIISAENLDELKLKLIEESVDKIMRENVFCWLKNLENNHQIKLTVDENIKNEFIEAYYRRNLLVHNNLIVNQDYLNNVSNDFVKNKLNDKLSVNKEYIDNIIKVERKVVLNLLYNIDKKINKNNANIKVLEKLTDYAYDCMMNKDFETSSYIYELFIDDNRQNEQEKLYAKINYWQSLKRLGKSEKIIEDIKRFDVTALDNTYKLAKEILLENYSEALELLEIAYSKREISVTQIERWPLFIEFRKTDEYKSFRNKYKHDYLNEEKNLDISDSELQTIIEELKNK